MALIIEDLFGFSPRDGSMLASKARKSEQCPFLNLPCTKRFRDGRLSGVCTVRQSTSVQATVCCPNRLYAEDYLILKETAKEVFGPNIELHSAVDARALLGQKNLVAVFGKKWGKELRLPGKMGKGRFFVDWVLAKLDSKGQVEEFLAIEVQTIDTTGNYGEQQGRLRDGEGDAGPSVAAGLNWENVSKRILPQLIFKGHVLQREQLCKKGLFFICPTDVFNRIIIRLGEQPAEIHKQPGAITFVCYDVDGVVKEGEPRALVRGKSYTTTVNEIALAFTSPRNLPPSGAYLQAINQSL